MYLYVHLDSHHGVARNRCATRGIQAGPCRSALPAGAQQPPRLPDVCASGVRPRPCVPQGAPPVAVPADVSALVVGCPLGTQVPPPIRDCTSHGDEHIAGEDRVGVLVRPGPIRQSSRLRRHSHPRNAGCGAQGTRLRHKGQGVRPRLRDGASHRPGALRRGPGVRSDGRDRPSDRVRRGGHHPRDGVAVTTSEGVKG